MTWNLMNPLKAVTYYNPKKIIRLSFNNRLNTQYVVIKDPIEKYDLGNNPTYKDYIKNALDPNVDSNSNIYGIAKVLKPLTTRLNEMKDNIDNANAAYFDLKKKVQEQQQEQQEQPQEPVKSPEPTSTEGGPNV